MPKCLHKARREIPRVLLSKSIKGHSPVAQPLANQTNPSQAKRVIDLVLKSK